LLQFLALAAGSLCLRAMPAAASEGTDRETSRRMRDGAPSATAQAAALYRAVHQFLDHPRVLDDPWALPIVGAPALAELQAAVDRQSRSMRAGIVLRSRYAEDRLAAAVARGVDQYVVLGAGLDTFAYRNPHAGLRVFEVDHPATQAWKRERLAAMDIAQPAWLTFVGVDFERESFAERLAESGFDASRRTFAFWLGVSMYLTAATVDATLAAVAAWPGGGEIVFDYAEPPPEDMSEQARAARDALRARVAAVGEPFRSALEPEPLHARLGELGYADIEDLTPLDLAERFLGPEIAAAARAAGAGGRGGGHVLFART
jgi:methyltransferase (TIGR00027 family)